MIGRTLSGVLAHAFRLAAAGLALCGLLFLFLWPEPPRAVATLLAALVFAQLGGSFPLVHRTRDVRERDETPARGIVRGPSDRR